MNRNAFVRHVYRRYREAIGELLIGTRKEEEKKKGARGFYGIGKSRLDTASISSGGTLGG